MISLIKIIVGCEIIAPNINEEVDINNVAELICLKCFEDFFQLTDVHKPLFSNVSTDFTSRELIKDPM